MNIIIAGGGTGGHVFPGIALAETIRKQDPTARIAFVGTAAGLEARVVPQHGFELVLIRVAGLRGKSLPSLARGVGLLPVALWDAYRALIRQQPDLVIGVGGYAAGPTVALAAMLGIPTAVLEQNATAGVTNRMLARVARRVIVAMPVTNLPAQRTVVMGNPVRQEIVAARDAPYRDALSQRTLLVLGGSQGARAINDLMIESAASFENANLRVTHQTGPRDFERVQSAYRERGVERVRVVAFIDDMAAAYRDAALIVARAGATTVAEITVVGRPAILIPFPFAVDDHQTKNASALAAEGAAIVHPERYLTSGAFAKEVVELFADPSALETMATASRRFGRPQAARDIVRFLDQELVNV